MAIIIKYWYIPLVGIVLFIMYKTKRAVDSAVVSPGIRSVTVSSAADTHGDVTPQQSKG